MWPTAARKLRTEKQMDAERKNKHQENRKAEAAQLEEDEKITILLECGRL
jgi:hypothetical protein